MKENIKALRYWPWWGEFIGDWWIPCTKGQSRGIYIHLMTSSWCTRLWVANRVIMCKSLRVILNDYAKFQTKKRADQIRMPIKFTHKETDRAWHGLSLRLIVKRLRVIVNVNALSFTMTRDSCRLPVIICRLCVNLATSHIHCYFCTLLIDTEYDDWFLSWHVIVKNTRNHSQWRVKFYDYA